MLKKHRKTVCGKGKVAERDTKLVGYGKGNGGRGVRVAKRERWTYVRRRARPDRVYREGEVEEVLGRHRKEEVRDRRGARVMRDEERGVGGNGKREKKKTRRSAAVPSEGTGRAMPSPTHADFKWY